MNTDRLRTAATLLRERAEAATPGPWEAWSGASAGGGEYVSSLAESEGHYTFGIDSALSGEVCFRRSRADAAYIAIMHPKVALVTAKLLDGVALVHELREKSVAAHLAAEAHGGYCGCEYKDCYDCGKWHNCIHRIPPLMDEALAVADAILGK